MSLVEGQAETQVRSVCLERIAAHINRSKGIPGRYIPNGKRNDIIVCTCVGVDLPLDGRRIAFRRNGIS